MSVHLLRVGFKSAVHRIERIADRDLRIEVIPVVAWVLAEDNFMLGQH